jgi:NADH-quinone oxidoreductase subunit L
MMILLAIPVLPLLAALAALGFGRRLPWGGGELVVGAVALSLIGLFFVPNGTKLSAIWFESGGYRLTVGLEVTQLTWFIAMIVAGAAGSALTQWDVDLREERRQFPAQDKKGE